MSVPFSIVTITRNDRTGLLMTRDSILSQTFSEFEWIIVDGASTDGSANLVAEWCNGKVHAISGVDKGIYDAMNKGLSIAGGEYVIFMNSGDRFAGSNVLSALYEVIKESDVDVMYGASVMRFPSRSVTRRVRRPEYIWHGQPGLHQATAFRRSVHLNYLFDLTFKICGDYDVITRMWRDRRSFGFTNVIVSENEFTHLSTSGSNKMQLIREAMRCQRNNLGLPWPKITLSALLRAQNSLAAVVLSRLRVL